MSANQVSDEILEEYVNQGIEKWLKGELFITAGIGENDMILTPGGNLPPDEDKGHIYNKFLGTVAEQMMGDFGLGTKEKKRFVKQLQSRSKRWQALIIPKCEEIAARMPSPVNGSSGKDSETNVKQEDMLPPEDSDKQFAKETIIAGNEGSLEKNLDEKRKAFEKARDLILDEVPGHYKARFGQIYFAKWGKQTLPCLALSPYSVPPGGVRDNWLNMFDNVRVGIIQLFCVSF